jgi:hypothetical protein
MTYIIVIQPLSIIKMETYFNMTKTFEISIILSIKTSEYP